MPHGTARFSLRAPGTLRFDLRRWTRRGEWREGCPFDGSRVLTESSLEGEWSAGKTLEGAT